MDLPDLFFNPDWFMLKLLCVQNKSALFVGSLVLTVRLLENLSPSFQFIQNVYH